MDTFGTKTSGLYWPRYYRTYGPEAIRHQTEIGIRHGALASGVVQHELGHAATDVALSEQGLHFTPKLYNSYKSLMEALADKYGVVSSRVSRVPFQTHPDVWKAAAAPFPPEVKRIESFLSQMTEKNTVDVFSNLKDWLNEFLIPQLGK
jgi:hypothetical protein